MDWVSFDEIKKAVTLQMAIDHYGIQMRRVNATTLRGKCPLPTHSSKESKESFTATLNKGVGGAWACQSQSCIKARGRTGGNVLDFVAAMERCSIRDAAVKLQTWFAVPATNNSSRTNSTQSREKRIANEKPHRDSAIQKDHDRGGESESNKPLSFTLQHIDHGHAYLIERGLTLETTEKFGVGFFPGKGSMSGRIVIPIHNAKGELVAYAGRCIDGSEPRYKFPTGFHKAMELFNLHRVRNEVSVVLVEGFFDCMKVTQAGFPCVALMGSTMSDVQQELIRQHFAHVVVMLDGDEAGRVATDVIEERLRCAVFQANVVALTDNRQPDELLDSELYALLDSYK